MPILETLPDEVQNRLRELRSEFGSAFGRAPGEGVEALGERDEMADETGPEDSEPPEPLSPVAFETDINQVGEFGAEWLVVDTGRVFVMAPNGNRIAHLIRSVPISEIRDARTEMKAGNGVLEVRTASEVVPLVRFSHSTVGDANLVARHISALAKGETAQPLVGEENQRQCPKCKRILPKDTNVCPACVDRRAVMLRLFKFLAPYKVTACASVLVLLCTTTVTMAPPYIIGRLANIVVHGNVNLQLRYADVVRWVSLLIGVQVVLAVLQYFQRRINAWLGARVLVDIRMALYRKFNELSLRYYDKRTTGSVMARITNDSDNLWDFLTDGIPWLIQTLLTLVETSIILFRLDWSLAMLLLIPGPFIFALNRWFMPRARRRWRHVWHRISRMYSTLNSTINGMRVVKAFAQEDREIDRFQRRNEQVFEASYAANSMWATYFPVLSLLTASGTIIIWLVAGHAVVFGSMTIGLLLMFTGYVGQFYMPFQNFSRVMDWSARSMTAADRVFEVLDTVPEIAEAAEPVAAPHIRGDVEFRHVSFSYEKAHRVLEDFDLQVAAGEMIGLVGPSGAGKTTIINLLSRFYDVEEGSILIDGVDVRNMRMEDFRSQIGIVLQEPFLFPGTVRDNIGYAKPGATHEEILRAAKAANCHQFILKFPDGYDTYVGERGQRLSGGERQRISIARAILHNPRILILDEATASVDTETEQLIQQAIMRLVKNRTTFAIAHRLSTLRYAHRLVVMTEGKMVECGSHDELMALDGVYANLVNIQLEVNQIRAV
ncbi:MAG: ATP-binding cassette domain-containing protein [Armatimonadetes bacterium]|nr:ATP-binding cassette domain-containing protein [Armatimonadota bacterium]MDE2205054.1 ATP-binding cassette domain-containing protein [Armatimonadota bacterium]